MLGIGSGSFDPETLRILETAFDEAWITLKSSGSGTIRPDELARRICHLAMEGERDPVRLHDRALGELIPATTWRELSLSRRIARDASACSAAISTLSGCHGLGM